MLERELLSSKETESILQSKVETLESQIALQKHEKNLLLQKHEDRINSLDSIVMSLHTQIEEKSNTIAQLVHKMHQMQRALQRGSGPPLNEQTLPILPPKDPPPSEGVYRYNRISRRVRKTTPITGSLPFTNDPNEFADRCSSGSLPSVQLYNSVAKGNGRSLSHGAPPTTPVTRIHSGRSSDRQSCDTEGKSNESWQHGINNHSTKSVLPPIASSDEQLKLPPIVPASPPADTNKVPAAQRLHQRFHLAKTQGLTSAPPSPVRFANYGGNSKDSNVVDETSTPAVVEQSDKGLLMVKHEASKTMLKRLHHQQESK